ncbi:PA3496 family putative envelope integrity protein [Thiorhodococcus fuscus]|uniref:PA3496 family putative envelope integrity protein n=1 Tax=Thiorhodococcus fuscus TaxID=527200 RepID=A0ABW4YBW3_9GAMM
MLDPESGYGDEVAERVPPLLAQEPRSQVASLEVRRRIEHMRELKRLRELLDDPDFDELS